MIPSEGGLFLFMDTFTPRRLRGTPDAGKRRLPLSHKPAAAPRNYRDTMNDFGKFVIKAFTRKALTALGAFLLTHGVLTEREAGGFVGQYLEEVTGAALLGASSVWTYVYQKYVKEKVTTALALPGGSSTVALKEAMGEGTRIDVTQPGEG